MKIVMEYDPWAEVQESKRAADALNTLGIPVQLREVRRRSQEQQRTFEVGRTMIGRQAPEAVVFDPPVN